MTKVKRVVSLTGMRIVTFFKQVSSFAAWFILLVIQSGTKVTCDPMFNNKKAVQTIGQLREPVRKSVSVRFGQLLIVGGRHFGHITLSRGLRNLSLNFSEHVACRDR